jgi:Ca-activated chloride channel family protein
MMSAPREDNFGGTEGYAPTAEAGWQRVTDHPLSTFAIDVDSASYANVRRFLNRGELPPVDAVRVEELINAFEYDYAAPRDADSPFAAQLEVGSAPWAPEHRLVRIGLKGREFAKGERASANLVFLLDVSGSMNAPQKLPLVKEAMRLLVGKLRPDDRVAIVTYAGASGLALPSTMADRRRDIYAALDALQPEGSTNGAMGIELAYDIAKANFVGGGINRVILCTDGDFNVGTTNEGDLGRLITEKAKSGVFLTALGFGMGNYQDAILEQLADKGNGNYGYIDSSREARRLLVEQVDGTLATIAKDVKIQVEFNPTQVAAYRLIGYENRLMAKEAFNDDQKDGGEIGAGHSVTALYEIVPAGSAAGLSGVAVDELRYATATKRSVATAVSHEMLIVKVRAKLPDGEVSRRWEFTLADPGVGFAATTPDFKFASAVAAFGMLLRDSSFRGTATWAKVVAWAEEGAGRDDSGYRGEFMALVRQAEALMPR